MISFYICYGAILDLEKNIDPVKNRLLKCMFFKL